MKLVENLWNGDTDLNFIYNQLFFLPSFTLPFYFGYVKNLPESNGETMYLHALLLTGFAALVIYCAFTMICVWRSATKHQVEALTNKSKNAVWGALAKAHVLLFSFALIIIILTLLGILDLENTIK